MVPLFVKSVPVKQNRREPFALLSIHMFRHVRVSVIAVCLGFGMHGEVLFSSVHSHMHVRLTAYVVCMMACMCQCCEEMTSGRCCA